MGEPGIAGVTLTVATGDGRPVLGAPSATTDQAGYFRFDGLAEGTYRVRVSPGAFDPGGPLAGLVSSTSVGPADTDGDDDGLDAPDPAAAGISSGDVALGPGAEPVGDLGGGPGHGGSDDHSNLTVDFGFTIPFAVGNRVWRDIDDDGRLTAADGASPGIAGVRLRLLGEDGLSPPGVAPTETDAQGFYRLDGVGIGRFRVVVDAANFAPGGPLDGWRSSSWTQGDADSDVDGDDNGADADLPDVTGVRSGLVTIRSAGEVLGDLGGGPGHGPGGDDHSNLTVDFGFLPLGRLGDTVWHDLDADGVQDPGEPGAEGVTVTLRKGAATVATTRTDADGRYRFAWVAPGDDYTVGFAVPAGYAASPPAATDAAHDSDADPATGRSAPFSVSGGSDRTDIDLGIWAAGSIGDRVWADLDGDGVQDGGEPGVGAVRLRLRRAAHVEAETTTDASGGYRFDRLAPGGDYRVEVVVPAGLRLSPRAAAGSPADSDPDPSSALTGPMIVVGGRADLGVDVGLYETSAIALDVFVDANGNGTRDATERGVPGAAVSIGSAVRTLTGLRTGVDGTLVVDGLVAGTLHGVGIAVPAGYRALRAERVEVVPAADRATAVAVPLASTKRETAVEGVPRLTLESDGPRVARPGGVAILVVSVRNGAARAGAAELVVAFPDGLRPLSSPGATIQGRTVRIALGDLDPRAVRRVRLRVRVERGARGRRFATIRASASGALPATHRRELRILAPSRPS